jgi:hypothetical protein
MTSIERLAGKFHGSGSQRHIHQAKTSALYDDAKAVAKLMYLDLGGIGLCGWCLVNGRLNSRVRFVPGEVIVTFETVCKAADRVVFHPIPAVCEVDDKIVGRVSAVNALRNVGWRQEMASMSRQGHRLRWEAVARLPFSMRMASHTLP